jgi:hypothetical protein
MMNGKPKAGPGEKIVQGHDVFKAQLSRIPQRVLSTQEIVAAFKPLFRDINAMTYPKKEALTKAQELADKHPIPAYGYPKCYMRVVAKEMTEDQLYSILEVSP